MATGNRKERRAKGGNSTTTSSSFGFQPTTELDQNGVDMILKHPDFSGPKGKTLFQLAEERQQELDQANPARAKAKAKAKKSQAAPAADSEPAVGPFGDAILYSISMAALHVTLDVIVYSQYREDILWNEIFTRAASATPIFILLVYLTHVDYSYRFPTTRDLTFFVGSIVAGCYLVYSGNRHGYFHVMKAAPPVGTLWIWSVVEMSVLYAALSAVIVFAYIWWNDFEFF